MISKHISTKEATRSVTALRLGIDNTPTPEHLQNMELIAEKVFEPLREFVGGPIRINSFYRCPELNKAIGGASKNGKQTSQHCYGQALDLDDTLGYMSNAQMFEYIKENLSFDQLIWEFGDDPTDPNANPDWVHVSYVDAESNRNRCLRAYKDNGRTRYEVI